MNWRFAWFYRCGLAALFILACWSVWADVVTPTNTVPPVAPEHHATNALMNWKAPTFGLDNFDSLCENKPLGEPLWKYLASLIYIVLAFGVAWLLDRLVNGWLKRLAARTESQYDDLLLALLRGPVKVVAFVILLHIGLGMFDWPERAQKYLSHALIVVVACSVTYVVLKMVDLLLAVWREKIISVQDKAFAEQLFPLLRKVTKVAVIIAAAVLTADNLDIKITSLLAGLSVGGLALGLAAQDTVANLFGAVAIFLDKPFYIGDRIKVENVDGAVESIGLRSTRVRNLDGYLVTLPNKLMGNAVITNITRRPNIKTEMNFGLTCDTPVEKVRRATAILEEIFRANPKTVDLIISFNKFADSSLNIYVSHVWNGTQDKVYYAEMQEFNLKIKQRFADEAIEFAFPSRTVYLQNAAGK